MKKTGIIIISAALIAAVGLSGCGKITETSESNGSVASGSGAGGNGETVYLQSKYTVTSTSDYVKSSSTVFKYDEQGNLIMSVYYDADEKMTGWDTDYTYNESGNELVHIQYDAEGTAYGFVSREYDENQKVTRYTTYSNNGEPITDTSYKYELDDKGNVVLMSCFDENGKHVQDNEYDDHGKIVKEIYYLDNSIAVYDYENEYDANGNNTKTTIYITYGNNGTRKLDSSNDLTYDEHGNMIKLVHHDANGNTEFYYEIEYFEYTKPA